MNSTISTPQDFVTASKFNSFEHVNSGSAGAFCKLELDANDPDTTELVNVSWNQDYSCFAAVTNHGFRIYNCEPFRETWRRDLKGGYGTVEMLFRCNIFALVGGATDSPYSNNKVVIWDDQQGRSIGEFSFRSEVRAVKLRKDRLVVVLEHKVFVYNFLGLKLLHQIETVSNPRGLCCLSHSMNTSVLVCPGRRRGEVRIEHFGLSLTKIIQAHESHLGCFSLTLDGLLLATASTKGTLIRIFNTMDGTCLQEVRRGTDKANVCGIAFSPNAQWLAVSSDKGTIHIFSLRVRIGGEDASVDSVSSQDTALAHGRSSSSLEPLIGADAGANPSLSLSFMKGMLPKYFQSEWSFARFHLPDNTRFIVAFGSHNTVNIVGLDGSFYRCSFDPLNGGEMCQVEYVRFLKA
ncbi:hypothetical protein Droror1_Dr00004721 [Drosera rotundifolia]